MNTSKRITVVNKLDDLIIYRLICSCNQSNHDLEIHLEKDTKFNLLILKFYATISINEHFRLWEENNFIGKTKKFLRTVWNRIKTSVKILIIGYIEIDQEFMIDDKTQIDDFIEALKEGKQYLDIE